MGLLSRAAFLVLLPMLLSVLAACTPPPIQVVKHATPNPFADGAEPHFVLVPFDWSELKVNDVHVEDWLATLDEGERESFETEKRDAEKAFRKELMKQARKQGVRVAHRDSEGTGYVLRMVAERFDRAGEIYFLLTIEDPDGNAVDVLRLAKDLPLSPGRKMETNAELYGFAVAEYLGNRVRGGGE